jgi:hypothetical protein
MSYHPVLRDGLFPRGIGDKLEKALQHVEAHGVLERRQDETKLARVEEATARGLVAVGQISGLEAALVQATPHAACRLRAVADAGIVGIVGIVARSGF